MGASSALASSSCVPFWRGSPLQLAAPRTSLASSSCLGVADGQARCATTATAMSLQSALDQLAARPSSD
eukprot:15474751-Alexandrium_andersonii.AAC.1